MYIPVAIFGPVLFSEVSYFIADISRIVVLVRRNDIETLQVSPTLKYGFIT